MLFLFLLAFQLAFQVSAEMSAFDQALSADTAVETQEANAEFFNIKYRKISTTQATFYAKAAPGGPDSIEVYCGQPKFFTEDHLKEGSTVTFKRSRKFIQSLNESCNAVDKKKKMDLELQPKTADKK